MADERTRQAGRTTPEAGAEPLWRELIGEQLRAARQQRGETLQTVGRRASVSTQYLSEVERGRKEPSSEMISALGAALGLTLLDLTVGAARRLDAARAVGRSGFRLAA